VDDPRATVEALADDDESGASEIAQRAARALQQVPPDDLPDAIETLLRGHPEMGPLWRLASDVLSANDAAAGAQMFLSRLAEDANAVPVLAPILPNRVITISYSGTVKDAVRMREPTNVLCMSSQPGGEGLKMMGALAAYTDASVIDDAEAIEQCPADAVVVGADAITPTSLVNKVKTRQIAESARDHGIPCFALTGETKFVPSELPVGEPFEATGLHLFSGIATPMGLLLPTEAGAHASSVELHPALRMLIERFDDDVPEEPAS
jgi:translation initiation factor 2B subunit (eIF-2B alpha/beta/delta family)